MTGIRARTLEASLRAADYEIVGKNGDDAAVTDDLPREARDDLVRLYRSLGGVLDLEDFASGDWDFDLADGLKIELDEFLHFNRYRATTLAMPWAETLAWSADYEAYCQTFEYKCLRIRLEGTWASKSSDCMFGGSDPIGVLGNLGSSRWKQRALYDAVKDAFASHRNLAVARISVIDNINGKSIDRELKKGRLLDPDGLRSLIAARTASGSERGYSSLSPASE
jgi:hypothetical protein